MAKPDTPAGLVSRREFIETTAIASGGVLSATALGVQAARADEALPRQSPVTLTINGEQRTISIEARTTLLDVLRGEFGLTGTKKGCDRGECGACTVHINGRRVLACMTLAAMQGDKQIVTIEGLADGAKLHPVQAAFVEYDGFQCGFCTSGQIMSAVAAIDEARAGRPSAATTDVAKPFDLSDLSREEIRERMSGNLCRCACYPNIVDAVSAAARSA